MVCTLPRHLSAFHLHTHLPFTDSICIRECQRLHPGYEFKLWTDASARELVETEYPEYLEMYDGYGYGIQVWAAIRC